MPDQASQAGVFGSLFQAYGRDVRGWVGGVTARYAIAVGFFLAASAGIIGAVAVGIAALFRWLERTYGANLAYGGVAGILLLLSLASALVAWLLLRQALPPFPRPHRHAAVAGRSVADRARRAISNPSSTGSVVRLMKADAATEVMIGLAAACLVGWLVSSRIGQRQRMADDK